MTLLSIKHLESAEALPGFILFFSDFYLHVDKPVDLEFTVSENRKLKTVQHLSPFDAKVMFPNDVCYF